MANSDAPYLGPNPERGTVAASISSVTAGASVGTDTQAFLTKAKQQFRASADYDSRLREKMRQDQRFRAADQWPANIRADRDADMRPCLTINRLPVFIRQVTNQQRQSKPSVQINPVDSGSDPETAEVLQGIIRHIENQSQADVAYDTACDHQVTMGRGYVRIIVDWSEINPWEQEIRIKRIRNPFMVYFDPACKEVDYRDARYAFVVEDIPRDDFIAQYGEANAQNSMLFSSIGDKAPEWYPEGKIRVAEYFYIEATKEKMSLLSNGEEMTDASLADPDVKEFMAATGVKVARSRTIERKKVKWAKITGSTVLERAEWPGRWIPIVPVLGEEIDLNGEVDLKGMVRDAQDPQRMYNYWVPLALDTPIPTPSGWSTMGELQAGDVVFDNKGKPCKVLGTSPVHLDRECFKVTFDDGTSIIADKEHPWQVEERGKRMDPTWQWTTKQVTTGELVPKKHFIWATKPLSLDDAELPIDPYVLGVWLSDGDSAEPRITQNLKDIDALRDTLASHGARFGPVSVEGENAGRFTINGIRSKLTAAGLIGDKHIPASYLRGSLPQRLALLQGLMDGDGAIATNGMRTCDFTTGSIAIRDGMSELLRSLGIKAKYDTRTPETSTLKDGRLIIGRLPMYQFSFTAPPPEAMPIFGYPRKYAHQKAKNGKYHPRRTDRFGIKSIEPVASVPVKCIGVDSPDHLFLAGESMVPTHNSAETETIALAPRAPFVGYEGQFEGYEAQWQMANRRNLPYLQAKPVTIAGTMAPLPQRQSIEPPIAAIVAATKQSDNDLKAVTGFYDASLGERGPEQSGKAILARQRQGDISNIHWMDNLARAIRAVGRILVDLIPKIYDTPRVVRILGLDDQEMMVMVHAGNKESVPAADQLGKGIKGVYDLSVGRYDVTVSVGPSYQSRRQEAVEAMTAFVQAFPPAAPAIGDVLAENMDWPGAQVIAKRLKKMIPPELQDTPPGEEEIPQAAQQKMSQMGQALEQAKAIIDGMKKELDTQSVQAQSAERIAMIRAQTEIAIASLNSKTDASIELAKQQQEQFAVAIAQGHEKELRTMELDHEKQIANAELSDAAHGRVVDATMTAAKLAADVRRDETKARAAANKPKPAAKPAAAKKPSK